MKFFTSLLFTLLFVSKSFSQVDKPNFFVQGSFNDIRDGIVFLSLYKEEGVQKDSSLIINGNFLFQHNISKPIYAVLSLPGRQKDALVFYAEPVTMKITGKGDTLKNMLITGSKLNEDDRKLKKELTYLGEWEKKNYELSLKARENKNQHVLDSLDELETVLMAEKRKVVSKFVFAHPNSLRSAMAIEENFGYYAEASEVKPLYEILSANIKLSEKGKKIKQMLDVYETVAIGKIAPEIEQPDTLGKIIKLSSLKGKYVLVDFWASWCGPCRKENPNIVKAYNQFHHKGFEIMGVSYDTEKGKEKWLKAIKDDQLFWMQVSDLQGWKNASSDKYYIKAIPSNVLLDKEGRIIAKNLFGKKLNEKLSELMP